MEPGSTIKSSSGHVAGFPVIFQFGGPVTLVTDLTKAIRDASQRDCRIDHDIHSSQRAMNIMISAQGMSTLTILKLGLEATQPAT